MPSHTQKRMSLDMLKLLIEHMKGPLPFIAHCGRSRDALMRRRFIERTPDKRATVITDSGRASIIWLMQKRFVNPDRVLSGIFFSPPPDNL